MKSREVIMSAFGVGVGCGQDFKRGAPAFLPSSEGLKEVLADMPVVAWSCSWWEREVASNGADAVGLIVIHKVSQPPLLDAIHLERPIRTAVQSTPRVAALREIGEPFPLLSGLAERQGLAD
jgi:hypothetical protein